MQDFLRHCPYSQGGCRPHSHPREAFWGLGIRQGVRADDHVVLAQPKGVGFHKLNLKRGLVFAEHVPIYQVTIPSNSTFVAHLEDDEARTQVPVLKEEWGPRTLGGEQKYLPGHLDVKGGKLIVICAHKTQNATYITKSRV